MSETKLLGSSKVVRAVTDLNCRGKLIRGRQRTRVDGKLGSFEIIETPGETAEIDALFAKDLVANGSAILIEGGYCSVIPEADGFNRYVAWNPQRTKPEVYECVETLCTVAWAGMFFPKGAKIRLDINQFDRGYYCYSDETLLYSHQLRVQKQSPKKVRISQEEQAQKLNAVFEKMFPAAV